MTKPSKTPPRFLNAGASTSDDFTHRESHDTYRGKIVNCRDVWRVIICRDGMQFIVQRRSSGTNTGVWAGKSHCATREELINVCERLELLSNAYVEATLRALPKYARDYSADRGDQCDG